MMRVGTLIFASAMAGCYIDVGTRTPAPVSAAQSEHSALAGWSVEGAGKLAYAAEVDGDIQREGHPTVRFHPTRDAGGAYAVYMTAIDAAPLRGRRAHAVVWVRTQGVTGRGDAWLRAQSASGTGDGPGLAASIVRLAPSAGFSRYELTIDVPDEAARVELGVGIGGPGMLWLDGVRVEAL